MSERKGRQREFFVINSGTKDITISGIREPNQMKGLGTRKIPIWILESRAEIDRIIRDLEEARDRTFGEHPQAEKHRPAPGGISIGHHIKSAGTRP